METKKHTVLVVDDVVENITLLGSLLGQEYDIRFATNGGDALSVVAGPGEIDLILLDVVMPGVDGFEVCRRLKDDAATREIPIIFVTKKNMEKDEAAGLELGAVDYITKPLRPAIVLARVRTHVAFSDARRNLAKQNDELIEAARLREDVDAIMQHDLKTPLTTAVSLSKLMRADPNLPPKHEEYLRLIEEAGLRTLLLINRPMDLMRIERGSYQFEPETVDLLDLVRDLVDENTALARRSGVEINLSAVGLPMAEDGSDEQQILVRCERLLSYAALTNLLVNAIEASPEAAVVTVTVTADKDPTVRIHNPGAVPEEVRERFFVKYATAGKIDGTGLGTYSAKRMIAVQQGSIAMQTDPVEGTTLTVVLPRASAGSLSGNTLDQTI